MLFSAFFSLTAILPLKRQAYEVRRNAPSSSSCHVLLPLREGQYSFFMM
jgi:hypothetical protein